LKGEDLTSDIPANLGTKVSVFFFPFLSSCTVRILYEGFLYFHGMTVFVMWSFLFLSSLKEVRLNTHSGKEAKQFK